MKWTIFFLIGLFISMQINGQQPSAEKITVSGRVLDSLSQKAIEFATISFRSGDHLLGTTTDNRGYFNLAITPGNYEVRVEFLSFTPVVLKPREYTTSTNLGAINLVFRAEDLKEVEIVAQKDLVEFRVDKKIYNASKDIANLNGNAIDVLNNTPAVRIDDEGNAVMRGSTATILIDGKPLLGLDNGSNILSTIPSSSIARVEIISRSAKYSAEGGGGILNIITKKRKGSGLSGSFDAHLGTPENNGASIFLNENTDKINIFSTISFNNNKKEKTITLEQDYFDTAGSPTGSFFEDRFDNLQRNSFLFNIGSDFYLNDNNTLTTSLLINTNNKNFYYDLDLKDYDPDNSLVNSALRQVADFDDISKIELFLNYTTLFDKEGHQLSFDFKYDNTISENEAEIAQMEEFPTLETQDQRVDKDQDLNNFLLQLDYSLPVSEDSKFELGYKGTLRYYKNDFKATQFDESLREFTVLNDFDNIINYDEKVHAFYGLFTSSNEVLSYSLGLRTETSDISFKEASIGDNYQKTYTDLFPSASIGYEFSNGSYLSLNYSRSIERPSIPQINPFIALSDTRFQSVGNPDLNPYYKNYFELLYDMSFEKLNLATSFYANMTKDQFLSVIQNSGQNEQDLETFTRTVINSGNNTSLGVDLDLTYRPIKGLRLHTYISPYNLEVSNSIDPSYDFSNLVLYAEASALISLDNGIRFQADYKYQSPIENGQTKLRTINFLNLTLTKDLLEKKASLSFKVVDVFNSKWFSTQSTEANSNTFRRVRFNQSFTLGFTYNFKQNRRSAKDRSNDANKDELEDKQDKKM